MRSHNEMESLAEAYALFALDPDERKAFEDHMATCDLCARRVAEVRPAVHAMALAAEEKTPPPTLRQRVLAAARAEKALGSPPPVSVSLPFWRRLLAWQAAPRAAAAAMVVVVLAVAGMGFWTYRLQDSLSTSESRLDRTYQAIDIMGQAGSWWKLEGTEAAPGTWGTLAYSSQLSAACLVLWDLPEAGGGRYYAWATKDGVTTPVGRLWTMESGMWLIIPGPVEQLGSLSVTLEDQLEPAQPQGSVIASLSLSSQ